MVEEGGAELGVVEDDGVEEGNASLLNPSVCPAPRRRSASDLNSIPPNQPTPADLFGNSGSNPANPAQINPESAQIVSKKDQIQGL